ncbi:MAG: ABC transporter permease [Candidatus Eisenbacteria bacterium]|jgi:ABC-2 type transport system permease protein|nr:ABC transporter permease [Candidatus Eisenbacteria bacterium]
MHVMLVVLRKELAQLRRDPRILPILFIAPVMQMLILGYAATTDVKHVELAVCDLDRSPMSRRLVEAFTSSRYFHVAALVTSQADIDRLLQGGEARIALTIPAGFGAARQAGRTGRVQLIADGSDPSGGTIGLAYAANVIGGMALEGLKPLVELRPVVRYNPDLLSKNFMVPATLAQIIMVMTMMLTGMALVRETEVGTMEQLLVTPIRPEALIVGKLLAYALVALVEILSALPVVLFWFDVPLRGSFLTLMALSLLFMLCTLGLGLLISTLARTQQQAMMITAFVFMLPQIYLSGFAFPLQNMPKAFQLISYAVPLRYYVTILRGVFLKGVGLSVLWPEALALLGLGLAILTLARLRFRKRLG